MGKKVKAIPTPPPVVEEPSDDDDLDYMLEEEEVGVEDDVEEDVESENEAVEAEEEQEEVLEEESDSEMKEEGVMSAEAVIANAMKKFKSAGLDHKTSDDLTYDLGNLTAFDNSALDPKKMTKSGLEDYLKELTRDNTQLLINQIFSLPREKSEVGPLAALPEPSTILPREKPLPKPKEKTKWEKFAEKKGIQNKKRERMVFDEQSDSYKPRFGYKRGGTLNEVDIMPHDSKIPVGSDPWTQESVDKKERVKKNEKQRLANKKQALKKQEKSLPSTLALTGNNYHKKNDIHRAVVHSQTSTASYGKFDKAVEGEPNKLKGKRRKFQPAEATKGEKEGSMKVYSKLFTKEGTLNVNKAVKNAQTEKSIESRKRQASRAAQGQAGRKKGRK
eukprot:TRINITY_DN21259_c0_g1_i1.p1 TRINITY_DN21259_c0_g1~~TRINITY_DN21259_c0_g1_i1.p1  ORF type:complete len:389 (+),score=164.37 TRINITY_DN21259_c0_g1_i1:27-1193(+)